MLRTRWVRELLRHPISFGSAALLLVASAPVLLPTCAWLLMRQGTAVRSRLRLGRGFTAFRCYDLRVPRGIDGRLLRRLRIDHLPRLLNIMRGDLAWVGPRPLAAGLADLCRDDLTLVLRSRPGLLDPAGTTGQPLGIDDWLDEAIRYTDGRWPASKSAVAMRHGFEFLRGRRRVVRGGTEPATTTPPTPTTDVVELAEVREQPAEPQTEGSSDAERSAGSPLPDAAAARPLKLATMPVERPAVADELRETAGATSETAAAVS